MADADPGPAERLDQEGYLDDLGERPLEWVRAERAAIAALEDGISYARRMVQGRLDIVTAERRRRSEGGTHDLSSLVEQLPGILAERVHAPGLGRLSAVDPGDVDPGLRQRIIAAVSEEVLIRPTEVADAELAATATALADLEREVSEQRRSCHRALDRLNAEVVRRYRDGEANVDSLLR